MGENITDTDGGVILTPTGRICKPEEVPTARVVFFPELHPVYHGVVQDS